jgi:hypothetical protein
MTILDRQLERRSRLDFHYPNGNGDTTTRTLGFLENVDVTEKRKTNYTKYNPIGNNGQSFVFTGSDSRSLQLSFNLTLPHIMRYVQLKDKMDNSSEDITIESYNITPEAAGGGAIGNSLFSNILNRTQDFNNDFINNIINSDTYDQILQVGSNEDSRLRAIAQVMYCINLIRTSLLTHSQKAYLGPPVVRLHHGLLFQSIPCVVENYSIEIDQLAGYDLETLLPNRLKINMSLLEVRIRGRAFVPKSDGDYVPGWDSVINSNYSTIDPADDVGGVL